MRASFPFPAGIFSVPALLILAACNGPDSLESDPDSGPGGDPDAGRYHAKSFFWNAADKPAPLEKAVARSTRFETPAALEQAYLEAQANLRVPGFADSLWKPVDYACDALELALWNAHGTIRLRDSLVLDEALLKSRCRSVREESFAQSAAKTSAYAAGEAEHRSHPYKMIGRCWSDRDLLVFRYAGAETQFKKERDYLGIRGWWDTDAVRVGVRIHLLNCAGSRPDICYSGGEKSAWNRNSASAGQTDFSSPGETEVRTAGLPAGIKRLNLRVSAAVIALHSVDHAGIRFRARSSSGFTRATALVALPALEYVTW